MVRLAKLAILLALLPLLGGCVTTGSIGSILGGECQLMHTPDFAVRGKTTYDQVWINKTTEAMVKGCKQPRPKARPASLDAKPTPAQVAAVVPKAKPKGRLRRWLGV